jgi:hypothetical protein
MKTFLMVLALSMGSYAFAQEVTLSDFNNWKLTDIAAKGYKKEALFSKMNRDLIKVGASICSNRALVWAYDFKRNQNIDAGKLFLFYTKKTGEVGQTTWWYHVTPIINENGSIFAMDAGFPGNIKSPITPKEWLKKFSGSSNCKEIKSGENDLIERMFYGYIFPGTTSHGTYDCYYSMTPGGYWTPSSVAMGLLGIDENGKPVQYIRDEINHEEVYAACVEAVTGPIARVLGGGKKRCAKYLGMEIPL